jgi:hypothetical protein
MVLVGLCEKLSRQKIDILFDQTLESCEVLGLVSERLRQVPGEARRDSLVVA